MRSIPVHLVLGVLTLTVWCGCRRESARVEPPPEATAATNVSAAVPARSEFEPLKGRWERPDGGYVLEIRSADAEGKLEAAYFNPSPIHVAQARAYRNENALRVFIELRDVNYPGCTYKLVYDPKSEQLFGEYYQAVMQQTFDVTFARMK